MTRELQTRHEAIDWLGLENDVIERIHALRECWKASELQINVPKEVHEKLVRDLYFPCVELLGQFVASVKLGD